MSGEQIQRTYNTANPTDFRAIYDATFSLLYKVVWRVVNDEEAAEDIVHDSYIKASEKNMFFPSLDDAKFWLIRVVKNASLNYAKRKSRENKAYHKVLYESKKSSESADTALLKEDAKRIALEALNRLPKGLREVLILREYGDLNYKEIGKVLGITEGNVKIRMFRAREKLMKILEADDVYIS